jgi:hypothetical protein
VQSQSDIFIAGRHFDTHDLGLYAEALFLTQIFAAKFVPPLNEVAFPAYARMQHDPSALASSFLKAVRLIMLIALPALSREWRFQQDPLSRPSWGRNGPGQFRWCRFSRSPCRS